MDNSPFSRLSAELRNKIYIFTLVEEDPIELAAPSSDFKIRTALARTCRQLRQESLSLFYASNDFIITIKDDVLTHIQLGCTSLQIFSQGCLARLGKLTVHYEAGRNPTVGFPTRDGRNPIVGFFSGVDMLCQGIAVTGFAYKDVSWSTVHPASMLMTDTQPATLTPSQLLATVYLYMGQSRSQLFLMKMRQRFAEAYTARSEKWEMVVVPEEQERLWETIWEAIHQEYSRQ